MSNSTFPSSVQPGIPKRKVIPEGWERSTMNRHLRKMSRRVKLQDDETYELVTVRRSRGGVESRGILLGKQIAVKSQFRVSEYDFLISKRQIVHGACGLVPKSLEGAIVSNEYDVFRCQPTLDISFLSYLTHTIYFQQTCFHSSIGVHIEKMIFKTDRWLSFEFQIPPLLEQKKIAQILSTWDDAITANEDLLVNSRLRKKALMQQLLTGKKRLPGFSGEWEKNRLSNFGNCIRGVSYKPEYISPTESQNTVRLLRSSNIQNNLLNDHDLVLLPRQYVKKKQMLNSGDLVLCMANGSKALVGKAAPFKKAEKGYTIGAFCAIFRPLTTVSQSFAKFLFESPEYQRQLLLILAGSSINNLKGSDIEAMKVSAPTDILEQDAIASVLALADEEIEALEQRINNLKLQKKALMQQLLTGKKRVKVEPVTA